MRRLWACGLLAGSVLAQAQAPDLRRPGWMDMSPALQALQRDPTQHPGQLAVAEGQALWSAPGANGRRCADCHAQPPPVAARYPVLHAATGRPLTLATRIQQCRQTHQGEPSTGTHGADSPAVLALQAWLSDRSQGQPVTPDPRLHAWADRGQTLWHQRVGQLDLACAQCHDQRAGQRLGGAVIPQAHPTGYPTYRLEWQGMGSLQRRMHGCLSGVRAQPYPAEADEWLALEVWLMQRAAGMRWEGVALRP